MPQRRSLALGVHSILLLSVAATAGTIDPDNPPSGTFVDDWMVVRMGGVDTGWARSTMTREGDRVAARTTMFLSIARAGQKIEVHITESSTETLAGRPVSFGSKMKLSAMQTEMRGKIENGKVHITTTQFGMTQEQTYDYPPGAKMTWGLLAEQLRRGLDPGTEYDVRSYVPTLQADAAVNTHVLVKGKESVEVMGQAVEGTRVLATIQSPLGELATISWLDSDGMVLRSEIPFPGLGSLELIRAEEATARAAGGGSAEMFINTLIAVDRPIDRDAARSIRYKLTLTGTEGDARPDIPPTAMQTPGDWTGRSIELRVSRIDHKKLRGAERSSPAENMAVFLSPNVWINSDDPKIVEMAHKAAGNETSLYAVCDRLRRHVTDVIKEKNLSVGFATASEVCRNREGDCSEHAVLLAALGRVLGVPSRVVCGIVYVPTFGTADDVFGFHMWTQLHIGGQWVDFDAAQGETDCNPTHIAFATSSLRDASMGELAFALLKVLGQIKLEVIRIEPRPDTVPRP